MKRAAFTRISRPVRLLVACSSLSCCWGAAFADAPQVEETVLGPANAGGAYVISPRGAHVAYAGKNGAKYYVSFDGVAGPEFDELFKSAGQGFYFPEKAAIYPGKQTGAQMGDSPVVFSADGEHYAYVARSGDDYVVMHDGKEVGRGPRPSLTIFGTNGMLSITPNGKHVFWAETEQNQGRSVTRLVVSGRRGPFAVGMAPTLPTFSSDESHYAYVLSQALDNGKQMLVVDGKDAGYLGQSPTYTADGSTLLCIGYANAQGGTAGLLANGKIVYEGMINKIVTAPAGNRWAALANVQLSNGRYAPILVVDGEEIPGSENVQELWFSPDGTRYAARCHDMITQDFTLVLDGDAYTMDRIDPLAYWTGDGSLVILTGASGGDEILMVNDNLYGTGGGAVTITVAERGDRFAWAVANHSTREYAVYVGEEGALPGGAYPTSNFYFSPDGSRYGFTIGPIGRNETTNLVIDGQVVDGVSPGAFLTYATGKMDVIFPVAFSPAGEHVAYLANVEPSPTRALMLDGTPVFSTTQGVIAPRFTADGQHFFWTAIEMGTGTGATHIVYVDGQEAVRAGGNFFNETPGVFDVDADGVATFVATDGDMVKRWCITPASDTNVGTLIEQGTAGSIP
jgi:hypothetical protein